MTVKGVLFVLLIIASGYGALLLLVSCSQSRLLYFPDMPTRQLATTPDSVGLSFESIDFVTDDGLKLHGWFLPAPRPRGTLLFFHGNAGNISHRLDSLKIFNDLGLETLIFDYRGYGLSAGRPSEEGTYRDAEAALRYLRNQRGVPSEEVILFGRSLGGAIAAYLAHRSDVKALILESAFTSVPDVAEAIYPLFPTRWLVRFHYDTREYVQKLTCPVLVIHSREDDIIPYKHGRRLFSSANQPKRFLELRGGHNDGFMVSRSAYLVGLEGFFSSLGLDRPN